MARIEKHSLSWLALALVLPLWWGLSHPLAKLIISNFPPISFLVMRYLLAAFIVLPFLRLRPGDFTKLLGITTLYMTIPFIGSTIALQYMDASLVALFWRLDTPLLVLIGAVVFQEKINRWHFIGVALALAGVYLVVDSPEIRFDHPTGVLAIIITLVSYLIGTTLMRRSTLAPKQIFMWGHILGLPQMIGFAFFIGEHPIDNIIAAPLWVSITAVLVGLASFTANSIFASLARRHGFAKIAPFGMLAPFIAVGGGYCILGETLAPEAFFGGTLIISGIATITWLATKRQPVFAK